jgi:hypothetical protein
MPGSERQNNMFEASPVKNYKQEGNPFAVTSCGRRRNKGQSIFKKLRKTTKGKGRHFLTAKEGAGMTAAGRRAYNKETGGNLKAPQPGGGKRKKSYCARSAGQMKMHNINCSKTPKKRICAARRRWKC